MPRIVASFFSGVEANHVAIERAAVPWRTDTVSEIEPFPCAVLAERCPDAVNLGDFTKLNPADMYAAEIAVGGPPCQSFSIAGGRKGLDDERGNLTLQYVDLCHDLNTNGSLRVAFYENVPGILSDKTNAFGCLISALVGGVAPLRKPRDASWPSFGMASGPRARLAWRTLDAQWFGLAQRRRRVFIVVCFDKRLDPAKILFERKSLQGNTPPSRGQRQIFTSNARNGVKKRVAEDRDLTGTLCARTGISRSVQDASDYHIFPEITHTLRGEGFDASEDGTGRGTPLVPEIHCADVASTLNAAFGDKPGLEDQHINSGAPLFVQEKYEVDEWALVAFNARQDPDVTGARAGALNAGSPQDQALAFKIRGGCEGGGKGYLGSEDHAFTVSTVNDQHVMTSEAIAFAQNTRDEVRLINGDGAITGALAAETGAKQQSYIAEPKAFDMRGREGGAQMEGPHDTANIRAASGGSSKSYIASQYAVRRLMPVETERLQGFPDGWTKISYRGKPAEDCPDGHRYKAMGNSWAVNVIAWIYTRVEAEMSAIDLTSEQ